MATLTNAERTELVKKALGISGTFQDESLNIYINEAMLFMQDAGVKEEIAQGLSAIGAIVLFVNDNWNYSSGEVKQSEAFTKRLIQLASR